MPGRSKKTAVKTKAGVPLQSRQQDDVISISSAEHDGENSPASSVMAGRVSAASKRR